MMISFLLLLLTLTLGQDQPAIGGPSNGVPSTGGTVNTAQPTGIHQFFSVNLPRICKECCFDIMFVLDRSESVSEKLTSSGTFEKGSNDDWRAMKNIIADLAVLELNDKRVRVGAMQMGNSEKGTKEEIVSGAGSPKTGIAFSMQYGPFNEKQREAWGVSQTETDVFASGEPDYHLAAKVALEELTSVKPPYETEGNDQCTPANFRRVVVWVVESALTDNAKSPCVKQTNEASSVISQMLDASVYNYVVGITGEQPNSAQISYDGLKCMFPAAKDFKGLINETPKWDDLRTKTNELFGLDPCSTCQPLDVVFLLDESSSLCEKADCVNKPEWDDQIDFVEQMIQELAPSWNDHRVSIWTFGSKAKHHVSLKCTGAESAKVYPGTTKDSNACGKDKLLTAADVQRKLQWIKENFQKGETALAYAMSGAIEELEFVPDRVDGRPSRKVVILMTDGGPNPGYYAVGTNGKRYSTSTCPKSKNGYCLAPYHAKFFIKKKDTMQNMALCTDPEDPQPPARRVRINAQNQMEEYPNGDAKGYQGVLKELNIVPIIIKSGEAARIKEHKKDIDCLLYKKGNKDVGGVLDDISFGVFKKNRSYSRAVIDAMCKDTPLSSGTQELAESSSQNIFARWNQYVEWKQAQQQAPVATGQLHVGASLMFGMVVGGIMVVAAKRTSSSKYDYEQLLNTESV